MSLESLRDFYDHPLFCREALTIRDKSGIRVPMILSPLGLKLCKAVEKQERTGRPVRIFLGPKPRQAFASTVVASIIYKRVAYLPGQHAMAFGDVYRTAKNLWSYYHQFAKDSAPEFRGIPRPKIKRANRDKLIEWHGGSWVEMQSAESSTPGRSFSVRHFHFSEYAFYQHASDLMTGAMNSIPNDPLTTVIVESTAFGMGGDFYNMWERLSDRANGEDWEVVFSEWFEHPEYVRALEVDPRQFQDSMNEEERRLQIAGCKFEQLNWRRWKIRTDLEGSVRRFHQEFPATPEEAFLTSGRTVFDMDAVGRMPVIRAWLAGELRKIQIGTAETIQFVPREDGQGPLQILRRPEKGAAYVIGVDTAEGKDAGDGRGETNSDFSTAVVLNQATGEQVAVLRTRHMATSVFGDYVVDLALWYNGAFLTPEANSYGNAVLQVILNRQYPIERIYWRQRQATDQRHGRLEDLGFWTGGGRDGTKVQLISSLDTAMIHGAIAVTHPQTVQELRTYVRDAMGRTNAAEGKHDDLVIALALAVVGMRTAPLQQPKPKMVEMTGQYRRTVTYGTARR